MAERKRRGLGRGLGALINSDAAPEDEETDPPIDEGSHGDASDIPEPEIATSNSGEGPTPSTDTLTQSEVVDDADEVRPTRPVDVFFSAKSHVATERVSRETSSTGAGKRSTANKRHQMPEVQSVRERLNSRSASSPSSVERSDRLRSTSEVTHSPGFAVSVSNAVDPEDSQSNPAEMSNSWTSSVSRETTGVIDGAYFESIPVARISPNPRQPRQEFDEEDMAELVHSVREIGVLQPIVVRSTGDDTYELVMGERRWRASQLAELTSVPAIVRETSDHDMLRDALLENIHRSELNPLEEAAAYRQLLDDFNCTQDQLSERIGRSRPQISNTLRLMRLPPSVQRKVAAGVLSSGHARALLGLNNAEDMDTLAQRIIAEGLSVRATEEAVTVAMREHKSNVSRETPSRRSARYQQLDEFADALTDRLDTQVKITLGAKKGRIAIDFASVDDLQRLMTMIGSTESA